ncbi:MAG: hypothetical protein KIS85_08930 [Anaerolineales bacterium]|nr:hypothetical protein [Anaerolineales bacterium]
MMRLIALASALVGACILLAACAGPAENPPEPRVTSAASGVATRTLLPTPTPEMQRSMEDRPDDFPGQYQVHVFYVTLLGSMDGKRDLDGAIQRTVESANQWFFEQSGSRIRFDTYQGELDITYVQLPLTNRQFHQGTLDQFGDALWTRDHLELWLDRLGLLQPGKLYLAVFEIDRHPLSCADAAHPPHLLGRAAGWYPRAVLDSGYDCAVENFGSGETLVDMGVVHEIVHLLGFASACSQNPASPENIAHTGDDNRDLMWGPSAGDARHWDTANMLLDPGNDDYFRHGVAGCADLADSAFLEPLPANPQLPLGWPEAWHLAGDEAP